LLSAALVYYESTDSKAVVLLGAECKKKKVTLTRSDTITNAVGAGNAAAPLSKILFGQN